MPSRLRAVLRLQAFAIGSWLIVGRGLLAGVVTSPFPDRWRRSCWHVSRWAALGARCLGICVRTVGALPPAGSLVVANHQGYVDIVTIGGLFPSIFAARHDMRSWPMLGALAAAGSTIFINRDLKRAGVRGLGQATAALGAGATVIAFPEGTSTDGTGLLPFKTGIFQPAIDAGAPVVPAGIRYLELDGRALGEAERAVVGWYAGEPFLGHILGLGGRRSVLAEVRFGEPLRPPHADRRTLAAAAEAAVRELVGIEAGRLPREVGRRTRGRADA